MTDLALDRYDPRTTAFHQEPITRDQVELLKRTICKGASDDELKLFVLVCNRRGLDPFAGQIHAVKRKEYNSETKQYELKMTIQTGIDGYRLIAKRTGDYAGRVGPWWCGPDGKWRDVWLDKNPPAAAKVGVRQRSTPEPTFAIARWDAYVQTKSGGGPNHMWQQMGPEQLAKCAEALALRVLFPQELSGVYTDDEMPEVEESPGPNQLTPSAGGLGASTSVPTLDQVKQVRSVRAAKELIQAASEPFRSKVPAAIDALHHGEERLADPRDFWALADLDQWRQVLEYTVELYLHDHETSAAGGSPRPAAGPQSDPSLTGEGSGGSDDPEGSAP